MQIIGQMVNYLSITQQQQEVKVLGVNNKAIIINSYANSTRQKTISTSAACTIYCIRNFSRN